MPYYDEKLVISGNICERYKYSWSIIYGFSRKKQDKINIFKKKLRSQFSASRSAGKIRNLVNSNPQLDKFLTLSIRENQKNLTIANKEFKKFVQRLTRFYPSFQYICIVEFQKRGAVHYHLVCNLKYTPKKQIEKIWSLGFIKINRVKSIKSLGNYFIKNIQSYNLGATVSTHGNKKSAYEEERKLLAGRKKFFCSRGLIPPEVKIDKSDIKSFKDKNNLHLTFQKSWISSYNELKVEYKSYTIKKAQCLETLEK